MSGSDDDINEPEEEDLVKDVSEVRMSRTQEPEYEIDFKKIGDKTVYDGMGNGIRFGDIYKNQKTIIIFLRHFMDFITIDYLKDVAIIPLEYLQKADVRLVLIGPAPFKFINGMKGETGLQYPLYCDSDREIYSALNLSTKYEPVDLSKSRHIKQSTFMGMLRGTWKAMKTQEWQGDYKQQGGAFIFGPGDVVHFHHVDLHQADHVPLNKILVEAGVQQVSFPKDPRVEQV